MNRIFSEKINILKALAISLVVSGHLEFSIFGMFPPYSFHIALFFFISGMLFKDEYLDKVSEYVQRRVRSLLVLYFVYTAFYTVVTVVIAQITGKYWGMEPTFSNFLITPFLNGHQLDLACPLWFVPQLFITLMVFLFLQRLFREKSEIVRGAFYTFVGLAAIPFSKYFSPEGIFLPLIRTMFSLFFVYLGHIYKTKICGRYDIFTQKIIGTVICIQALLWHFNRDFTPERGIGLSYVLVWARFDNQIIVPLLTSITGIWFSLFFVHTAYNCLKNIKFIRMIGENTYHIMANHLFVMYLITILVLKINGIPLSERNSHDIYWVYNPVQNTYIYFILVMCITTYSGVLLKYIKSKILR